MVYTCKYKSPLGEILLAADEIWLTGLRFEGPKSFANTLPDEHISQETEILTETKKCLDEYFSGEEPKFTPKRLRQLAVQLDIMRFPLSFPATES